MAREQARTPAHAPNPWAGPGVTVTALTQVPGWFARPDTPRPTPAVLLLHPAGAWDRRGTHSARDTGTDHDTHLFDDLVASLLAAGVAVIGFDSRFVTARRPGGWEPGRVTFPALIHDAVTLTRYLRAHPGVDPDRISLLGISLGTQIAAGAAAHIGGPCRLILAAPAAVTLDYHLAWMHIGRRLEWLLAAGQVNPDATVDLDRLSALSAQRAGWWDTFDAADFTRGTEPVTYEHVADVLHHQHDTVIRDLYTTGDLHSPAEYWQTRRTHPPMAETLTGLRGKAWLHVGDEDWITPPRQALLLAHSAPPGLDVHVTVHPGLGHLFSPRDAQGRLTFGPFHPSAIAALTASALA